MELEKKYFTVQFDEFTPEGIEMVYKINLLECAAVGMSENAPPKPQSVFGDFIMLHGRRKEGKGMENLPDPQEHPLSPPLYAKSEPFYQKAILIKAAIKCLHSSRSVTFF